MVKISKTKYIVTALLLISLALTTASCFFPMPQAPPQAPTPPSPKTTTANHISGVPIDPSWTLPAQRGKTATPLPSIAEVVKKATPSVVAIQTEVITYDIFLQPTPQHGAGTGIIIDSKGYIVTNNHVVEGAKNIKVTLTDNRIFNAIKVQGDPQNDLAVIQIDGKNVPQAQLGRSEELNVGDWVVAIGNALALPGGPTVTAGIVSYLGRSIQEPNGVVLYDLIQTDAAINPGNSGGPLLNMLGEVVGINAAIAAGAENIGFAISISPALPIIEQLIRYGRVIRPWLGVTWADLTPTTISRYRLSVNEGALIVFVQENSPAHKAEIKPNDVIINFGGEKITTTEQLRQILYSHKIGEKVTVILMRGDKQITTTIILGESPPR